MMKGVLALGIGAILTFTVACSDQNVPQGPKLSELVEPELTEAPFKALISGNTIIDYSVQHGTQVEYFAPGGKAYLWYPGNRKIVIGRWEVDTIYAKTDIAAICFRYGPNTYNPVTKTAGGSRQCQASDRYIYASEELLKGDPFSLSSGAIPFVLKKKQYTSGGLAARAKILPPISAVAPIQPK